MAYICNLNYHIVFCTKYRKKVFTNEMLSDIEKDFNEISLNWSSLLLEFNGERDHIHFILKIPPSKCISNLICNLKATSCKNQYIKNKKYLRTFYWSKNILWSSGYYIESLGKSDITTIQNYIKKQNRPLN